MLISSLPESFMSSVGVRSSFDAPGTGTASGQGRLGESRRVFWTAPHKSEYR